jgi:hypothetical protein
VLACFDVQCFQAQSFCVFIFVCLFVYLFICLCVRTRTDLNLTFAFLYSHPRWLPSGHLGTWRDFNQNVVLPMTKGSQPNSSNDEIATRARKQEALNEAMAPISLRRTKELLKDQLPTKRDMVVFCLPTVMQRECYNNMLDSDDAQVLLQRNDPCDHKPPWVLARRHKYEPNAATLGLLVVKLKRILCSDVLRRMSVGAERPCACARTRQSDVEPLCSVGAARPCACVRTLYSRHPSVRC